MAKVSACIITYNHEKYIKDCLEGALEQIVNFTYEIVISEDCSTDRTREIVKEYKEKYPDKIKLFLNEKNLGLIGNWMQALRLCQGEYVAICEGDDYWTNSYKLQKQIDFLDSNTGFALSSHNANIIKNGKIIRQYCHANKPEIMDLEHLLFYGSGAPTCSLVIRNKTIKNLPDWFSQMFSCDWTVQVIAAKQGKMKYFKDIMGTYRKHDQGAMFSAKVDAQKKGKSDFALPSKYSLEMIDALNKHYNYKYDKQLRQTGTYWYNLYVDEYLKIGDIKMARRYTIKILTNIFPLKYLSYATWMNGQRFLKLLSLFLPFSWQQRLKTIYNFLKNFFKNANK